MSARGGKDMNEPPALAAMSICVCSANRANDLACARKSLERLRIPARGGGR
jgi:hypothetical protein